MEDKIKKSGRGLAQNYSEKRPHHCVCNPHDLYPPGQPPPIPESYGRNDLWDLQFCRWWGWNWVLNKEVHARHEEPKAKNHKQIPTNGYDIKGAESSVVLIDGAHNGHSKNALKTLHSPQKQQIRKDSSSLHQPQQQQQQETRTSNASSHLPPEYQTRTNNGLSNISQQYQTRPSYGSANPSHQQSRKSNVDNPSPLLRIPILKDCCGGRPGSHSSPPPPHDNQSIDSQLNRSKKSREGNNDISGYPTLPTKKQFKEMCKCLLGKRQKTNGCCQFAAMANLYKTPSSSKCAMGRLNRTDLPFDDWPECSAPPMNKQERDCQDTCQTWTNVPIEETVLTTTSEAFSTGSRRGYSSYSEKSADTPVRARPVESDTKQCAAYVRPRINEEVHRSPSKGKQRKIDRQTQTHNIRETRETQTSRNSFPENLKQPSKNLYPENLKQPSKNLYPENLKQTCRNLCPDHVKPHKEVKDRKERRRSQGVCVPGCTANTEQIYNVTQAKEVKEVKDRRPRKASASQGACETGGCTTYAEQTYNINSSKHKTLCIRVCCCGNCKPIITADGTESFEPSHQDGKNSTSKYHHDDKNKGTSTKDKEFPITYPIIMPPSSTKMLSKFGTPSQNYPWMQDIGSDATTTTLNNWETYKSPASGKTYEFKSIVEFDSYDSFSLPDLIDITEDLSYLKRIENATNKSDNESRLLLDAVCDAILHEHEERSLDFLEDLQTDTVNDALQRRYTELETLCDLTRRFRSKSDVHTELSRAYFANEDVGINTSAPKSDPDDNFKRMIKNIMENKTHVDPNVEERRFNKVSPEPVNPNSETRKNDQPYGFKGIDADVFTKTKLLAAKRNEANKRPIKREAPNSTKKENNSKKVKHEEESKPRNQETIVPKQNVRSVGPTTEKTGTIYSKIETIVKRNKVENADIHKMLGYPIERHKEPSAEVSENLIETHCLVPGRSSSENTYNKLEKLESNSSKKIYKMSSDAFLGGIGPFVPKTSEHKRCYNIFSDKLEHDLNDYSKSCSGIASQIIFEEDFTKSYEDVYKIGGKKSLEKHSKLSVQSFVVCDEKSTVDQKPCSSGTCQKRDKPFKNNKISSIASPIPIRKQSSDGNLSKPY